MEARKPIPTVVNHAIVALILEHYGWTAEIGGKHSTKMTKVGERPITVPRHQGKGFGPALRAAILKQTGLQP